jgi:hypothetical protein
MIINIRFMGFLWLASLTLVLPVRAATADPVGTRYALVIGNSTYDHEKEISGRADASRMRDYLNQLHFTDVMFVDDGNKDRIEKALEEFSKRIRGASLVLFFYSGHGFQDGNQNYILPTDGTINPAKPEDSAIALSFIADKLAVADNASKILIFDACRTKRGEPRKVPPGFAPPPLPPAKTTYIFATAYGQESDSGPTADDLSPYSRILLSRLREPGLSFRDLIVETRLKVLDETHGRQEPRSEGLEAVPPDLYLQQPVYVNASLKDQDVDDQLLIFLNDELVMSGGSRGDEVGKLRLRAGENRLKLMVYNQAQFHNGQPWGRTEGWKYKLELSPEDDSDEKEFVGGENFVFADGEDAPFKDGPRMGQLFEVAEAVVNVDPGTAKVSLASQKLDLWRDDEPVYTQQQKILYERKLRDLLPGNQLSGLVRAFLRAQFPDLARSDVFLGVTAFVVSRFVDLDKIHAVVWGNARNEPDAIRCMQDHLEDRQREFQDSIEQAGEGSQKPLESFVNGLNACMGDGKNVWVALEDRPFV